MTITQDEAIQMAREAGAANNAYNEQCFLPEELTAFANEVRRKALLEAAEVATCGGFGSRVVEEVIAEELRRMAEGE